VIEDFEAIRRLTHDYAYYVDTGQLEACAALFLDDAVWDISKIGMQRHEGRAEILAQLEKMAASSSQKCHLTTNHSIDLAGDRASGRCYILALSHGRDGVDRTSAVYYDDEYVRADDGWRFASRILQNLIPARSGSAAS
jgi:uncharacterized protein (TIGR02246 family)